MCTLKKEIPAMFINCAGQGGITKLEASIVYYYIPATINSFVYMGAWAMPAIITRGTVLNININI